MRIAKILEFAGLEVKIPDLFGQAVQDACKCEGRILNAIINSTTFIPRQRAVPSPNSYAIAGYNVGASGYAQAGDIKGAIN